MADFLFEDKCGSTLGLTTNFIRHFLQCIRYTRTRPGVIVSLLFVRDKNISYNTHRFNTFAIHFVMFLRACEVQTSITFLADKKVWKIYLREEVRNTKSSIYKALFGLDCQTAKHRLLCSTGSR